MSSESAIVKLSRSKNRYTYQDKLLRAFVDMPGSTAKEVAKQMLGWFDEPYCDSPKRAADLASERLRYLEQVCDRVCHQTNAEAHTYRVTQRGMDHLRKIGLLAVDVARPETKQTINPRDALRDCQTSLRG